MINLGDGPFRVAQARDIILGELRLAGVTNITVEEKEVKVLDPESEAGQLSRHGIMVPSLAKRYLRETHFNVSGKLHGWELDRAWTYWVVKTKDENSLIGIEDAKILHAKHGKKLRVAGHCGCPPPEHPWLYYKQRASAVHIGHGAVLTLDGEIHKVIDPRYEPDKSWLTEVEELDKKYPGVDLGMSGYHIDTQETFNAFCAYLIGRAPVVEKARDDFFDECHERNEYGKAFKPKIDGYIKKEKEHAQA